MMQLCVCNIDEEGRFGGPERRIVLVAEGLTKLGVETIVLIPEVDSQKFEDELRSRNIRYGKINYSRLTLEGPHLLRYVIRFPIELLATARFLRMSGADAVHVNGSYQFRSALAAFFARKRIIWHVNDAKMHWLVKIFFKALAPRLAQGYIFSSDIARDYYFPSGFDRTRIRCTSIAPPVQIERFTPRPFPASQSSASAHDGKFKIVTVTGINPDKGVECFIETAALVYKARADVTFIVAAAILESHLKYFGELKALVLAKGLPDDAFQFIGFVDDIPRFLAEGDIFLYTSNTEAGPTAVWEAMAAGLPVVTTNVGAIPEYLKDGIHAFIAPPRDAQGLSRHVLQLIDDPTVRTALGLAARAKVEQSLSVDAAAQKHAAFYREIIANA